VRESDEGGEKDKERGGNEAHISEEVATRDSISMCLACAAPTLRRADKKKEREEGEEKREVRHKKRDYLLALFVITNNSRELTSHQNTLVFMYDSVSTCCNVLRCVVMEIQNA
jgi:hypothetical protein